MAKKKVVEICDLPGVGETISTKLIKGGIDTIMQLSVSTPLEVSTASGLSEEVAKKIIRAAWENLDLGFGDASEVEKIRENVFYLTTGSDMFDEMMCPEYNKQKAIIEAKSDMSDEQKAEEISKLTKGFESGSITECYGAFGSSKTQVAHQMAVNVQLPPYNGMCAYIDTEGAFRPQRIRGIAKAKGLDEEQALKNIKYVKVHTTDHQVAMGEKVEQLIKNNPIKLLIVDSMTNLFRSEYVGRGTLADKQQKLNKHMRQLAKLADVYNIVVYVTNQVTVKPDLFYGDPTMPIGGNIAGHNSKYRVYLRKTSKGRIAKLVDAPHVADAECIFDITENGVEDIKSKS